MERTRRDYWDFVRGVAEEVFDKASGARSDEIDDELAEIASNTDWTTITHHAVATLLFTENRAAYDEMVGFEQGADAHDNIDSFLVNAAYCALLADLRAQFATLSERAKRI
jgi:hypothetical protein